ncbi:MAG: ABC transporter ATP-binding protein [Roseburia sp.]|nr:ABC transporter ATP-binding protein [Roseburia sp.]
MMNIYINNVSKSFGKKEVIKNLTLTFKDGEFTTLLGSSGCGKTTLLRMIAGLETPNSGEILFDDEIVFSTGKKINYSPEKRNLSFVFQDFALWPHMTVFENVAFGLRARKQKENLKEKVENALAIVKLEGFANRYPHELSGGQQQRVAFARAIVTEPRCILFDEPLSALDAQLREGMRIEIKQLTKKLGTTSVFVTHDQSEAMSMSDKIAIMNGGTVEQFDTPVEIYERPATKFVAQFIGKSNWLDENRMIRPEDINLKGKGHTEQGTVLSSHYQGGYFDIILTCSSGEWKLSSPKNLPIGSTVTIGFDEDKIKYFKEEQDNSQVVQSA